MTMTEKNNGFQALKEILPARVGAGGLVPVINLTSVYIVKIENRTI